MESDCLYDEGIEIYPVDEKSREDLLDHRLRLNVQRGELDYPELHYNLLILYRGPL